MELQQRAFYILGFVILLVLTALIIWPFLLSIIAGIIIAYLFYPLYKRLRKGIKKEWIAALLISLFVIAIITIPLVIFVNMFAKDAYVAYVLIKQRISKGITIETVCEEAGIKCAIVNFITGFVKDPQFNFYLNDGLNKVTNFVLEKTSDFIITLPRKIVDVLIILFVMFYTFKDGDVALKRLKNLIPLKLHHKKRIFERIDDMIKSTVYGMILIAILQGIVAGIGYYFFGLHSPILLGIVTAAAALIPVIGTVIIWLPAGLYLILNGLIYSNNTTVFNGVGLLIYGALLISTIDNLLKPKIIGDRAKMHPLLALLGILGGLALFGIVGALLGPLIIALFVAFIEIYEVEKGHHHET